MPAQSIQNWRLRVAMLTFSRQFNCLGSPEQQGEAPRRKRPLDFTKESFGKLVNDEAKKLFPNVRLCGSVTVLERHKLALHDAEVEAKTENSGDEQPQKEDARADEDGSGLLPAVKKKPEETGTDARTEADAPTAKRMKTAASRQADKPKTMKKVMKKKAVAEPEETGTDARTDANAPSSMEVGDAHFHHVLWFEDKVRIYRLDEHLRTMGIFTNCSTTHTEKWSAIQYVTVASDDKKTCEIDTDPFLFGVEKDDLFRLSQPARFNPQSKRMLMEKQQALPLSDANGKTRKKKRLTTTEMMALCMDKQLLSVDALRSFAMADGSDIERETIMTMGVNGKLGKFISEVHQFMESDKITARRAKTISDLMRDAAVQDCNHKNCTYVKDCQQLFEANWQCFATWSKALADGIVAGHSKEVPVVAIVGDSNAGKTLPMLSDL